MQNLQIRPVLIERAMGGWLAVTPRHASICFGVTAQTETEAREAFARTLKCWIETAETDAPTN